MEGRLAIRYRSGRWENAAMSRSDVPIRAFGHAIRIDLSQTPPEVPAEIARLWARCADPRPPQDAETITVRYVPPTEVTARGQVTQDGATVVEYARVEDLPYELSRTVTLTALRAVAGRHVLLHAAGLHDEATDRFLALVALGAAILAGAGVTWMNWLIGLGQQL